MEAKYLHARLANDSDEVLVKLETIDMPSLAAAKKRDTYDCALVEFNGKRIPIDRDWYEIALQQKQEREQRNHDRNTNLAAWGFAGIQGYQLYRQLFGSGAK